MTPEPQSLRVQCDKILKDTPKELKETLITLAVEFEKFDGKNEEEVLSNLRIFVCAFKQPLQEYGSRIRTDTIAETVQEERRATV